MSRLMNALKLLILVGIIPTAAWAADDQKVVPLLFESRHLDLVGKGADVTYQFDKKGSNEQLVGKDYSDQIHLGVAKVGDKGEREVTFQVFSGEYARDLQDYPDLTINPILLWYLERSMGTLSSLAGSAPGYLKARMMDALTDKAELEPIKFDYNGKQVDAFKVTVAPYVNDPNAKKMQGFEGAKFTIIVSKDVPGYFADLKASFESNQAAGPSVEEHIKLVGMGEAK